jgi:hypothetical protein
VGVFHKVVSLIVLAEDKVVNKKRLITITGSGFTFFITDKFIG